MPRRLIHLVPFPRVFVHRKRSWAACGCLCIFHMSFIILQIATVYLFSSHFSREVGQLSGQEWKHVDMVWKHRMRDAYCRTHHCDNNPFITITITVCITQSSVFNKLHVVGCSKERSAGTQALYFFYSVTWQAQHTHNEIRGVLKYSSLSRGGASGVQPKLLQSDLRLDPPLNFTSYIQGEC